MKFTIALSFSALFALVMPCFGQNLTLSLPAAGIEKPGLGQKQPGVVRIGVLKPKVTTPDTKNNPEAGSGIADAVSNSLVESLKGANIEVIAVTDASDAQAKSCDYTFVSNVVQKRGGGMFGGMMGKMVLMGAISVAGAMVPGIGGMVASTIASQVMSQTMMKEAKAKDEFAFDYKLIGGDNSIRASGATKGKSEKDGDDALSPQIQKASANVMTALGKKPAAQ